MRFSLVTQVVWLAAYGFQYGADARAVPNDLEVPSSALAIKDTDAYDVNDLKRASVDFVLPRVAAPPGGPVRQTPPSRPGNNNNNNNNNGGGSGSNTGNPGGPPQRQPPQRQSPPARIPGQQDNGLEQGGNNSPGDRINYFKNLVVRKQDSAVTEDNPCGIVPGSARRIKRAEEPKLGYEKIYQWLVDESGADRTKILFYSGSQSAGSGRADAANFIQNNPDYNYYFSLYDTEKMKAQLKAAGIPQDYFRTDEGAVEGSKALATFSKNPLVFKGDKAGSDTVWTKYEYPRMWGTGHGTISNLQDGTIDRTKVSATFPRPPQPPPGGDAGC